MPSTLQKFFRCLESTVLVFASLRQKEIALDHPNKVHG